MDAITQIETKIEEIKSTLETWTNQITHYQATLSQLTNQLTEIKKQLK